MKPDAPVPDEYLHSKPEPTLRDHREWLTKRIDEAECARTEHDAKRPTHGDIDAWLDRDEELSAVVSRLRAARALLDAHMAEAGR